MSKHARVAHITYVTEHGWWFWKYFQAVCGAEGCDWRIESSDPGLVDDASIFHSLRGE